jgi:CRISPR/Cas system-associated protein Csm6
MIGMPVLLITLDVTGIGTPSWVEEASILLLAGSVTGAAVSYILREKDEILSIIVALLTMIFIGFKYIF